ncbi:EpsG family protein [Leifsonia sp. YIM 134122]|uniref:EpsG family protein n=1 Tax=Leifsonia stereocauli TaxID=3134136 RepID=A0ABU9W8Y7_9MICO
MLPYLGIAVAVWVVANFQSAFRLTTRRMRSVREPAPVAELPSALATQADPKWGFGDVVIVAILVTFSALRFNVGTDYPIYLQFFRQIDPASDWAAQIAASPQEAGYTVLSLSIASLSDSPFAIFWATSFLTVVPIYAVLRRQSTDLPFALVLYILFAFFLGPFNTIRQGIAVSLLFWANSWYGRSKIVFAILSALAVLFHVSALVALALMLISKNWRPRLAPVLVSVAVMIALGTAALALPALLDVLSTLNSRYETYADDLGQAGGVGVFLLLAMRLALLVVAFRLPFPEGTVRWLAFVCVGTAFLALGTQSVVVARMDQYFGIFLLLLLPNQLSATKNPVPAKLALIVLGAAHLILYVTNYAGLLPYETYLGVR